MAAPEMSGQWGRKLQEVAGSRDSNHYVHLRLGGPFSQIGNLQDPKSH